MTGNRPDPRVAVVVATRNRRELLLQTLPRHVALPERPRVVVVDDASTDGTADAVERVPAVDGQPGHPLLMFIACAVVVRRAAVLAVGGFSERLGIGGEEELLGWDLASAGWSMSYVPEVVAHHHPPPNDGRPERRLLEVS